MIKSGDIVNLDNGATGEVKKVAILSTIIRTVNGDDIIVASDYYFALFRKLKQAGIEIPFPQRKLHLQSISPAVEEKIGRLIREKAGVAP